MHNSKSPNAVSTARIVVRHYPRQQQGRVRQVQGHNNLGQWFLNRSRGKNHRHRLQKTGVFLLLPLHIPNLLSSLKLLQCAQVLVLHHHHVSMLLFQQDTHVAVTVHRWYSLRVLANALVHNRQVHLQPRGVIKIGAAHMLGFRQKVQVGVDNTHQCTLVMYLILPELGQNIVLLHKDPSVLVIPSMSTCQCRRRRLRRRVVQARHVTTLTMWISTWSHMNKHPRVNHWYYWVLDRRHDLDRRLRLVTRFHQQYSKPHRSLSMPRNHHHNISSLQRIQRRRSSIRHVRMSLVGLDMG